MILKAVFYAGLFLFSVGMIAVFVWRSLDDLIAEVRPLSRYTVNDTGCCPRCRRRLSRTANRCARCRLRLSSRECRAQSVAQSYAISQKVNFGHHVRWDLSTTDGRRIAIVTPVGPAVRPSDQLQLLFDRRGRLRAMNNLDLATGWRLPTRIVGQRSVLSVIGLLILVPVATALIVAAPVYFLIQTLTQSFTALSNVVAAGASQAPRPHLGTGPFTASLLYLLALAAFGLLVTLARARPRINREIVQQ